MVPFNFNRCMRLVRDLLVENKRSLLMWWIIPLVAMVTLIVLMDYSFGGYGHRKYLYINGEDPMWGLNLFIMVSTVSILCYILAARGLNNTSNKQMAIYSLMLPVSEKERYIARFFIYVPLSTLVLLCGLLVVECLRFGILKVIYPHSAYLHFMTLGSIFNGNGLFCWSGALYYMGMQSFFFLGGAIWPKRGMIFTFVCFVIFYIFNFTVASLLLSNSNYDYLTSSSGFLSGVEGDKILFFLCLAFCILSCGVNYVLAYFRCKEREIINRW